MSLYKYTAIAKELNSKPKWTSLRHCILKKFCFYKRNKLSITRSWDY